MPYRTPARVADVTDADVIRFAASVRRARRHRTSLVIVVLILAGAAPLASAALVKPPRVRSFAPVYGRVPFEMCAPMWPGLGAPSCDPSMGRCPCDEHRSVWVP